MSPIESIPPINPSLPNTPVVPRRKAPEGRDEGEHQQDDDAKSPPEKKPDNSQPEKPNSSDSPTVGVDRYV